MLEPMPAELTSSSKIIILFSDVQARDISTDNLQQVVVFFYGYIFPEEYVIKFQSSRL